MAQLITREVEKPVDERTFVTKLAAMATNSTESDVRLLASALETLAYHRSQDRTFSTEDLAHLAGLNTAALERLAADARNAVHRAGDTGGDSVTIEQSVAALLRFTGSWTDFATVVADVLNESRATRTDYQDFIRQLERKVIPAALTNEPPADATQSESESEPSTESPLWRRH